MKKLLYLLLGTIVVSCQKTEQTIQYFKTNENLQNKTAPTFIRPDHIIYVWFENHGYSQIVGSAEAPYMNELIKKGTLFTNAKSFSNTSSYPNYIGWFAGQTFGITNNDCISGSPYSDSTIYNAIKTKGFSLTWYSEDLPSTGSEICSYGKYREKHNPTTIFSKVPASANQPFTAIKSKLQDTSQIAGLVKIGCVTPNMDNSMHDKPIGTGDAWLKANFSKYVDWAMTHNSILVVYFDEGGGSEPDRMPVIMVGQHVKKGYQDAGNYNHYSFTKLSCTMFGAPTNWSANVDAATLPMGWEN